MSTLNDVARWATVDPFVAFEELAAANTRAYEQLSVMDDTGKIECHANSTVPIEEPVSVFHTQLPVALALRTLAHSLAARTRGTTLDATLALLVAARYCHLCDVAVTKAMTARLFVASYRVVTKATHDGVVSAADFSAMAGIAPWELARLETTVLHGIDWAVHAAIGRPAETRDFGTASEPMLEDEAAERVAALSNLEAPAAAAAESSSDASAIRGKQEKLGKHDYFDNANSISDMHPGGGPLEVSVNPELPGAAAAAASNAHVGDFRCSPSTCSCSSSSGSSSSSSSSSSSQMHGYHRASSAAVVCRT